MREKSGIKQKTRKILLILISALLIPAILCACGCEHEWYKATCTEPKTCDKCGETEGEPLGHDWQEATCTEPKTCYVCGETEGEPLGHDWEEATCTVAKTCRRCDLREGEPLEHIPGEWETDKNDARMPWLVRYCEECGIKLDNKLDLPPSNDGETFLFTQEQFSGYFNALQVDACIPYIAAVDEYNNVKNCPIIDIHNDELFATVIFINDISGIFDESKYNSIFKSITTSFYTDDISKIEPVMRNIIITCDTSLTTSEVDEVMQQISMLNITSKPYHKNNLWYGFGALSEIKGFEDYNYYLLTISLGDFVM